jgi:parvulin-like peptidyl-prolyl isomerase
MRTSRKLAAVAAFFVVAVVIAGCGSSGVGNSAATVAGNPISIQAVNHWMYIAAKDQATTAAQEGETEPVVTAPDPPNFADCIKQIRAIVPTLTKAAAKTLKSDCQEVFTEYSGEVMAYLIEGYWYQADAHMLGVTYSNKALNAEIAKIEKTSFKSEAAFTAYLKQSGETLNDLKFQIRVNEIYTKLLAHYEKKVTTSAIDAYYKAHKASFASAASVSGHLIRVKTQASAQAALAALKSGSSWTAVAKQYAEGAASKTAGGVITDVTANEYEHAANAALFSAPVNKLVGPVKGIFGYYVLEVSKSTKSVQKTLAEESSTIKTLLTSDAKTTAESEITAYSKKHFGKQTLCSATYSVTDCANYKKPNTTTSAASSTSSGSSTATATTSGTATGTTSGSATTTVKTSGTATATTG